MRCIRLPVDGSSPTVVIFDMTALLCGLSQTHLGTPMPSGGGHIINAVFSPESTMAMSALAWGMTEVGMNNAFSNPLLSMRMLSLWMIRPWSTSKRAWGPHCNSLNLFEALSKS
jgi:hypothetical protein